MDFRWAWERSSRYRRGDAGVACIHRDQWPSCNTDGEGEHTASGRQLRTACTTARETRRAACSGPLRRTSGRRRPWRVEFQFLRLPSLAHLASRSWARINIADGPCSSRAYLAHALFTRLDIISDVNFLSLRMRTPTCMLDGLGDIGRELGCGVGWVDGCLLFAFFRELSVPLASDMFGDPRRFFDAACALFFRGSVCFWRPEDVPDSFEDVVSLRFFSSSAFLSSSFCASDPLSSEL